MRRIPLCVVFDLDQTLIDTSMLDCMRRQGQWSTAYSHINETVMYDGINRVLNLLYENSVPISIVTSSPRSYAIKVLDHHGIEYQSLTAYHDTKEHKPNSAPIVKGIEQFSSAVHILSIGDSAKDLIASKFDLRIIRIGAMWGSCENTRDMEIHAHHLFYSPNELYEYIKNGLTKKETII